MTGVTIRGSLFNSTLLTLTLTAAASAQPALPASQPAWTPHWDLVGGFHWMTRTDGDWNTRTPSEPQSSESLAGYGVGVGRYWTTHLKTEASISEFPGEFGLFDHETIVVAGRPQSVSTNRKSRLRQMTVGATYQFRENAFVHPFLTGGVRSEWVRVHRFRNAGIAIPALDERHVDTRLFAEVGGGAKLYFNKRAFLRPDVELARSGPFIAFTFRTAFGVDF